MVGPGHGNATLHFRRGEGGRAPSDLAPPALAAPPHPRDLAADEEKAAQGQAGARECLGGGVAARAVDDDAGDGGAEEDGEGDDGEDHAHADAFLQRGKMLARGQSAHILTSTKKSEDERGGAHQSFAGPW